MEPEDELDHLLDNLKADGVSAGSGAFTLQPERALQSLHEQGSVGGNAPLFLLRALYEHTRGEGLVWSKGLRKAVIRWPTERGPLPPSGPYRVMAEGAFQRSGLALSFQRHSVEISPTSRFGPSLSNLLEETFGRARERLLYFPLQGFSSQPPRRERWTQGEWEQGRFELGQEPGHPPSTVWVINGIEFREPSRLPLGQVVFDDRLPCDLTLSVVTKNARKTAWLAHLEEALQAVSRARLLEREEVALDLAPLSPELLRTLELLPYFVALPLDNPLRNLVLERVKFRDVFGRPRPLGSLLEWQKRGDLMMVPSLPRECPQQPVGEKPVLLWTGQTQALGQLVFPNLASGAGYLYSLYRAQSVQRTVERESERFLAQISWERGTLGLRPLGYSGDRCEIVMLGKRRGSETLYLETPAPPELSLVWQSSEEVVRWDDSPEFFADFTGQVVRLIDEAFAEVQPTAEFLRRLLMWATAVEDLASYPRLDHSPLWEKVPQGVVSTAFLRGYQQTAGAIPVLQERSASLPATLPFELMLWDHELLNRLGVETVEVSAVIRRAYWSEDGRRRWLSRSRPQAAQEWGAAQGLTLTSLPQGHLWGRQKAADLLSHLVVWREGRPLGPRILSQEEFPPGYLLIYQDDSFAADQYWSAPDPEGVKALAGWLRAVKLEVCPDDP